MKRSQMLLLTIVLLIGNPVMAQYPITPFNISPGGSQIRCDVSSTVNLSVPTQSGASYQWKKDPAWTPVGASAAVSPGSVGRPVIATYGNTPYVVFGDETNFGKATVVKFDGNNWVAVGTPGFSADRANFPYLVISKNGTPFVSYCDPANGYKATVMKFDGSDWVTVGIPGFATGPTYSIWGGLILAVDGNDVPHVVYQDAANGYVAMVMKFDGSNWVTVGPGPVSSGNADYISMGIDNTNIPYVTYVGSSANCTVKKFDGSDWVTVGPSVITSGYFPIINFDANNTPYFTCFDGSVGGSASVRTFDGSNWVPLGNLGFAPNAAAIPQLAFDRSGTPYVSYMDYGNNYQTSVMKFDGSNWNLVGTRGFSATTSGQANYSSIAIGDDGIPYVVFEDDGNGSKATVLKFDGTNIGSNSNLYSASSNGTYVAQITAGGFGAFSGNNTAVTADNINPTITAPADINVSTDASDCSASGVSLRNATTSDNCSVASLYNDAPASFPIGTTTVTWTVEDGNGNTANAVQTITVADTENPTINAPADINTTADAGSCFASGVSLGTATTSDNCSVASLSNDAPATFPLGTTTITWTVEDGSGNTATAIQTVTVTDIEIPTITAPADLNVSTDASDCFASGVSLGNATASDNCSVASLYNDAPTTFPIGTTTVTWTVEDGSGNTANAVQTVTVTDQVAPSIIVPADINTTIDASDCFASGVSLGTATASDNCSVASLYNDAPTTFPIGTTTVTWTVEDVSGNTNSAVQTVLVTDPTAPFISNCPSDITTDPNSGCNAVVSWTAPTANDNCGTTVSATHNPGDLFAAGTTTVTYTFDDGNGNSSSCSFNVTVNTSINLNVTGISSGNLLTASDNTADSYQWLNCDNENTPIAGQTNQIFSTLTPGNYSVIITKGTCSDTSACMPLFITAIKEYANTSKGIKVYPNPSSGIITLSVEKELNNATLSLLSIEGKKVLEISGNNGNNILLDLSKQANGIYILEINQEGELSRIKLTKN